MGDNRAHVVDAVRKPKPTPSALTELGSLSQGSPRVQPRHLREPRPTGEREPGRTRACPTSYLSFWLSGPVTSRRSPELNAWGKAAMRAARPGELEPNSRKLARPRPGPWLTPKRYLSCDSFASPSRAAASPRPPSSLLPQRPLRLRGSDPAPPLIGSPSRDAHWTAARRPLAR